MIAVPYGYWGKPPHSLKLTYQSLSRDQYIFRNVLSLPYKWFLSVFVLKAERDNSQEGFHGIEPEDMKI